MTQRVEALAGRLHADQLDPVVVDERDERTDRVEPPPTQAIRGPAARRCARQLRARLVADAALEVADERRVRRGPAQEPMM